MKSRREKAGAFRGLDLPDFIAAGDYITLTEGGERFYVKEYRERVEKRVTELAENHATVARIREGREVSDAQLIAKERTLRENLGHDADIELTTDNIRKAYGQKINRLIEFLRYLLDLEGMPDNEAIVTRAFERHIADAPYSADQIRFLRPVQSVFLKRKHLEEADLYEGAFSHFADGAVDRLFTVDEKCSILALSKILTI